MPRDLPLPPSADTPDLDAFVSAVEHQAVVATLKPLRGDLSERQWRTPVAAAVHEARNLAFGVRPHAHEYGLSCCTTGLCPFREPRVE
jgi:hypothetical protein